MKFNLKKLRAKLGYTQDRAARALGVTVRTWVRWELGEVEPPPEQARLIAALFSSSPVCRQATGIAKLIEHIEHCAKCRLKVTVALRSVAETDRSVAGFLAADQRLS